MYLAHIYDVRFLWTQNVWNPFKGRDTPQSNWVVRRTKIFLSDGTLILKGHEDHQFLSIYSVLLLHGMVWMSAGVPPEGSMEIHYKRRTPANLLGNCVENAHDWSLHLENKGRHRKCWPIGLDSFGGFSDTITSIKISVEILNALPTTEL